MHPPHSKDHRYVLLTGGAGYIGSHTLLAMLESTHHNYKLVVLDNLCNSSRESVKRVEELTGTTVDFHVADVTQLDDLERVFSFYPHPFYAVIHFAALKSVGESIQKPMLYYHNNVAGTVNLMQIMAKYGCFKLVVSSSAVVYSGIEDAGNAVEEFGGNGTLANPYGRSKWFMEEICRDACRADHRWRIIALRYFNPAGAHPSGRIGEDPSGIPANLTPYVVQVAIGKLAKVRVFGGDYDTPDGTGIRDYIHVMDLAKGHIAALNHLEHLGETEGERGVRHFREYNLGTGTGYSVLDIVKAMSKACGRDLPYEVLDRRPGDVARMTANPARANRELGWSTQHDLDDMCRDLWRWQSMNPHGYVEFKK